MATTCPACRSQDVQAGFNDFNCLRCNAVFDYEDLKPKPKRKKFRKRTDQKARS